MAGASKRVRTKAAARYLKRESASHAGSIPGGGAAHAHIDDGKEEQARFVGHIHFEKKLERGGRETEAEAATGAAAAASAAAAAAAAWKLTFSNMQTDFWLFQRLNMTLLKRRGVSVRLSKFNTVFRFECVSSSLLRRRCPQQRVMKATHGSSRLQT